MLVTLMVMDIKEKVGVIDVYIVVRHSLKIGKQKKKKEKKTLNKPKF